MDDQAPTRRELSRTIGNQGAWLALLTVGAAALVLTLVRKGVLSWDDLVSIGRPAGG